MRPIKINDKVMKWMLKQVRTNYLGALTSNKFQIELPMKYKKTDATPRPTITLTDVADQKIKALVSECSDEIGWHGLVRKDSDMQYTIYDIVVFPQYVTGATVNSDDETYGPWLMQFSDEDFNNIRFHGHSHVNMGVGPSGVDINYQDNMVSSVRDYYIFAIYNKKGEFNIWLYDVINNIMYETEDINYVATPIGGIAWAKEQIATMVLKKTFATANTNKNKPTTEELNAKWWDKKTADSSKKNNQYADDDDVDDYLTKYYRNKSKGGK